MEKSFADRVHMVDTTGYRTDLMVNDYVVPLNNFIKNYIGAILFGIVSVLGATPQEVVIVMDEMRAIKIYADDKEIEVRKRFVRDIVGSTVRGIVSPLKGVFLLDKVIIRSRRRI